MPSTLQTLQTNVNKRTDRIVTLMHPSDWMHPENRLRVVFIGEPAIDTGGPKSEFFSGE
jgi:hypothetical protein